MVGLYGTHLDLAAAVTLLSESCRDRHPGWDPATIGSRTRFQPPAPGSGRPRLDPTAGATPSRSTRPYLREPRGGAGACAGEEDARHRLGKPNSESTSRSVVFRFSIHSTNCCMPHSRASVVSSQKESPLALLEEA